MKIGPCARCHRAVQKLCKQQETQRVWFIPNAHNARLIPGGLMVKHEVLLTCFIATSPMSQCESPLQPTLWTMSLKKDAVWCCVTAVVETWIPCGISQPDMGITLLSRKKVDSLWLWPSVLQPSNLGVCRIDLPVELTIPVVSSLRKPSSAVGWDLQRCISFVGMSCKELLRRGSFFHVLPGFFQPKFQRQRLLSVQLPGFDPDLDQILKKVQRFVKDTFQIPSRSLES